MCRAPTGWPACGTSSSIHDNPTQIDEARSIGNGYFS